MDNKTKNTISRTTGVLALILFIVSAITLAYDEEFSRRVRNMVIIGMVLLIVSVSTSTSEIELPK